MPAALLGTHARAHLRLLLEAMRRLLLLVLLLFLLLWRLLLEALRQLLLLLLLVLLVLLLLWRLLLDADVCGQQSFVVFFHEPLCKQATTANICKPPRSGGMGGESRVRPAATSQRRPTTKWTPPAGINPKWVKHHMDDDGEAI